MNFLTFWRTIQAELKDLKKNFFEDDSLSEETASNSAAIADDLINYAEELKDLMMDYCLATLLKQEEESRQIIVKHHAVLTHRENARRARNNERTNEKITVLLICAESYEKMMARQSEMLMAEILAHALYRRSFPILT